MDAAAKECQHYKDRGVCPDGVHCRHYHNYALPLTTNHLRILLDKLVGDQHLLSVEIDRIHTRLTSLESDVQDIKHNVRELKRSDAAIANLSSSVARLVDRLKDVGISDLHLQVQPSSSETLPKGSIQARSQKYVEQSKYKGGGKKRGGGKGSSGQK